MYFSFFNDIIKMGDNMKEMRKSNFELLRIVCILMIITLHYNSSMGGVLNNVETNTVNYYVAHFIQSLCIVAVNAFIIITGYFSYKKNNIKISKIAHLFYLCLVYGILIFGIYLLLGNTIDKSTILEFIKTIFDRWFVVIYSILYLLIPYINKLINNLSEKELKTLIIINVVFFYIWFTIFTNTTIKDGGYGIVNFINLYIIGAYIKKYKDDYIPKYKTISIYLICAIITTLLSIYTTRSAYAYNTIFNLIGSISLFLTFKNINIKNSKLINKLSTYTFSVYIIHENSFLVKILYRDIFNCDEYYNNNLMPLNMIYTVLGIYLICVIVETIRRLLMEKVVDNKIDRIKYEIHVNKT